MDVETGKIGKEPKHDIHSDTSDAFQTFAMAMEIPNAPQRITREQYVGDGYRSPYFQQDPFSA